ncbi:SRPBCC family protein [Brevifollis gellanilyticus]|uniref:Activator of Hsp90 ATPase homologue 1/2-like C-terminal domain-containing protein n=1 Tax=Brevifollis gellanilyticus TaxID=748831 RepID=A0A512MGU9_9BACT|nr:SRPBCC family protein [Brevifollis gellanilyticus]GEP45958.1 hypothetical protein BGE01nite_52490 [Brevifollis gellanilyticus]
MNPLNQDHGTLVNSAEVRFVRMLPGPVERVWEFITDVDKRSQWFCGGTAEKKPGAPMKLTFNNKTLAPGPEEVPEKYKSHAADDIETDAVVTRCEPPKLYAFQWGEGEVIFELEPQGDKVKLTLTHRNLPNHKEVLDVSGGWHIHLTVLVAKLEGSQQPPFWSTLMRLEDEYLKLFGPAA